MNALRCLFENLLRGLLVLRALHKYMLIAEIERLG